MSIDGIAAAPLARRLRTVRAVAPGVLLVLLVATAAMAAAPLIAPLLPLPAMVLALLFGIALMPLGKRPAFEVGTAFCIRTVLRVAVALLGLRIAWSDIAALGAGTAMLVIAAMAATMVAGFALARLFHQTPGFGALAGAGTAVCGASATLAAASVLPAYHGKDAEIVFVVIAVNALSTLAMLLYPALCGALGFDATTTGIVLGATIHDVAQVVGAGYAVSDAAGNAAVIVKLFRVFLLLPVVLALGVWFARAGGRDAPAARVPVPVFALAFLLLCAINSLAPALPGAEAIYSPVKRVLVEASSLGLMLAIAALGLKTSFSDIAALGLRHVATVTGTTLVILAVVVAGVGLG